MTRHLLFGFHAVGVRLKTAPRSVVEVHVDGSRRDQRMRQLVARAEAAEVRLVDSDDKRLRWSRRLPSTWTSTTDRGAVLRRTPTAWKPNRRWRVIDGW